MGKVTGFLEFQRLEETHQEPEERKKHYREFILRLTEEEAKVQGARCMDCGTPFCMSGCPVNNIIPDFNELVYKQDWQRAIETLHSTNNFPEFTGRICPAPCEPACVLAINDDPVTIKGIELAIVERAFEEGWIRPRPPAVRTGRTVAVIGAGPAGMAAASQLNRTGHSVTLFERDEGLGGLMRFGVPDFKLEKSVIDRRTEIMEAEGIAFECGVDVGGADLPTDELMDRFDAVVIAIGSRVPRELDVPGRELEGVDWAMDYLYGCNRWVAGGGDDGGPERPITAAGKHVVVIGGGDTAMDCVGNAHREGALSVTVLDTYDEPPSPHARDAVPWPAAPKRLLSTYALDEGGERRWTQTAIALEARDGRVSGVRGTEVGAPPAFAPVPGTEFHLPAELVLVAIGFVHPEHEGLVGQLGVRLDRRGNVLGTAFETSRPGVFVAGDARRGQSLIVWAIAEGRAAAAAIHSYLGGEGSLPAPVTPSSVPLTVR
jgi:glutamate synthase (NADPH) small chain